MKKLISFLLLATVGLGFTACNKTKTQSASLNKSTFSPSLDTEKSVALNVIGVYGNFEALEEVFKDFNDYYPNVRLSYEYVSIMDSILENRCASGEDIDIIFLNSSDFKSFYREIAEKYLVDLNAARVDLSAIGKKFIDATNINGKQMFMPMYMMTTGLLVNETYLAKHRLSLPKTREQFEAVCDKLISEGITPIFTNSEASGLLFSNHVYSLIGKSDKTKFDEIQHGKNPILSKIFADSLKIHNEWKTKKYFDYSGNLLPDHYESIIYRFLEGDIPFMIANSDIISGMRKREAKSVAFKKSPFRYTYIPAPTGDEGPDCVLIPYMFFSLCNASKNLDYATEFMRFLATKESLKTMTTVKGMPSVIGDSEDSRLVHIEELPDSEIYVIGEDELSRTATSAMYYCSLKFDEAEGNPEYLSDLYENIVAGFNK